MAQYALRAPDELLDGWKAQAEAEGIPLSEWIRKTLGVPVREEEPAREGETSDAPTGEDVSPSPFDQARERYEREGYQPQLPYQGTAQEWNERMASLKEDEVEQDSPDIAPTQTTPREALAQAAVEAQNELTEFFRAAMRADKKVWVTCRVCNKRTDAEVPDWAARTKIVEAMLNQGYGRPNQELTENQQAFTLNRTIVAPDE